jgi:hypothetical protein
MSEVPLYEVDQYSPTVVEHTRRIQGRGTSLLRDSPPPQDYHRALGIFLAGRAVSYERGTPVYDSQDQRTGFQLEVPKTISLVLLAQQRLPSRIYYSE